MKKILTCTYRSQRDNEELPGSSCNVTSAVMALEASGHPPSEIVGLPAAEQPEDFLTDIGDSSEAYAVMKRISPWFFKENGDPLCRPPEAPLMLDWIVERAYGRSLMEYSEGNPFLHFVSEIDAGRASILRGKFTATGHIVAMIGYEAVGDIGGQIGDITGFIVNDPWGNFLTDYTDHDGEQVTIPIETIIRVARDYDSPFKVGHFIMEA